MNCDECLQMLDMAVSDALSGSPIQVLYPTFYQHLQTCLECRQAFEELLDTLKREAAGHILRAPHQQPQDPKRANWSLTLSPPDPSPWTQLDCFIPGAHLNAAITAPLSPPNTRGPALPKKQDRLLMADAIYRPPVTIAIQVSLEAHWSNPDLVTLLAELSSDSPLPNPMEAHLTWGGSVRIAPVDAAGRVSFDSLPAISGQEPIADLSLVFKQIVL